MSFLNKVFKFPFGKGFLKGLLFFLALTLPPSLFGEEGSLVVLGAVEILRIPSEGLVLDARVDTGAELSSLHAVDICVYKEEGTGKDMVRFTLAHDGGRRVMIEPLCSRVYIRQAASLSFRPTVLLDVKLGEYDLCAEFTLTDRSAMSHPVLIGRNILAGWALVDVARNFILSDPVPTQSVY